MPLRLVEAVDEWRRQQRDIPNRAEAIRRLVEQSLGIDRQC
jgi:metal-responsive CopG/Arc/MetJ family transcriptional regulator